MAGFADIGAALAGNSAGNELAYQKGLSLGAATQNAMQQARERVRQNTAMDSLTGLADELGIPAAYVTAIQAGVNPQQIAGTRKDIQEVGFRDRAADPSASPEAANVALRGVANAPVERYYKVGGSVADKFTEGLVPNPTPSETGDAAPIQVLRAFGFLDDTGHVPESMRPQAFDTMRTTGKTVDEGGVPGVINFNPFLPGAPRGPAGGAAPVVPAAAPGGLAADLAPPAPAAPAAPVVPPASLVQPASPVERVASNTAQIEKAKVIGKAAGEAEAGLPKSQATFTNQMANADTVMGYIDKALEGVGPLTSGPAGKVLSFVPGTPAYDFKKQIARIQANVGFKELATMRHESPTGGALGNVTERELEFLQSTMGNLDNAQSPSQLAEMLTDVRDSYGRFKKSLARDMAASTTTAGKAGGPAAPAAPETRTIGNRNFVKVNGQWMEDDGT